MTRPTADDVRSLAAKLEALELTDGERAVLDTVLDAAAGDEVAGYEDRRGVGDRLGSVLGPLVGTATLLGDDIGIPGSTGLLGDDIGIPRSGDGR
jgi:hypothetical protein